jgi:hypothetical protein
MSVNCLRDVKINLFKGCKKFHMKRSLLLNTLIDAHARAIRLKPVSTFDSFGAHQF